MKYLSILRHRRLWGVLSTVLVVFICLKLADPADMVNISTRMGWTNLIQIFALVAVTQLVRSLRFFTLLSSWTNIRYYLILKITCIYQFLNHILPMRSGELSFPFLLKRYSGCAYSSSVAQLILTRLYDLLSFAFIMAFSLVNLMDRGIIKSSWILGSVLCLLLAFPVVIFSLQLIYRRGNQPNSDNLVRFKKLSFLKPIFFRVKTFLKRIFQELLRYGDIILHLKLLGYSLLIWLVLFLIFWKVLLLAGIQMSFSEVVVGSSLANLTQLLPLNTVGNIGTLEAGWVLGFTMLGFDSRQVFAVGLLMHTVVIVAAGLYAFISWVFLLPRTRRS